MLVKITKEILPIYRELYRHNWPKHVATHLLFDHFTDRFNKFPEWESKVHFYRLAIDNVKVDYDATFVFVNGPHIYFDSITKDIKKLEKILNLLDYKEPKTFITIRDEFRGLIDDVIRINFLERTFDSGAKCILMTNSDLNLEGLKNKHIKPPEGFYFGDLSERDVDLMDSKWPQKFPNSREYLSTCIKYNPSTGLFRSSDNKLVGWAIVLETGVAGNLYILKEFRRQNIGTLLSEAHAVRTAKAGKKPGCGYILHYNDASFKMSSAFPDFLWVNNVSSIGVKKRIFNDFAPLWGHL